MSGFRSTHSSFSASEAPRPAGLRSAQSSFSGSDRPAVGSPWDTPVGTPFMSPATTPGGSPVQKPFNKDLPRPEDIKMILSDVDGTLFTDKHELHPKTRDAIRFLRETRPEMPIIPVTGKQLPSCGDLVTQLNIEEFPAACMHGAIIYDKDRNIEQSTSLDPHFVRDVSRLMRDHNKSTFLYVEDWNAMVTKEENGTKDWEQVARGFDPEVRDERKSDFMQRVLKKKEVISKIFLPMDEEVVPEYIQLLEKKFANVPFKITRALPYIIEIVAEGVDKSAALAFFCAKYDIKPENVLTFGDGENDCGMFAASGHSVSMGNAMPKPKQVAKYSTTSNNEGGVGDFLNAVFRPESAETAPNSGLSVDHLKALDASSVGTSSPLAAGAYP
ncbi:hypothetical protein JCM8547_009332 [Rhodosporidiobolus lusitaniae]